MKFLLRHFAIYTFSLYLLQFIISGMVINGGLATLFIGGALLTAMFLVLKPIMNLLSFPLNIITLGFVSTITNILILYLLTVFIPSISILPFTFQGAQIAGFIIPRIAFSTFFAYAVSAVTLVVTVSLFSWIFD
jgi:putative membrane protein